jgi:hypothetical protein
MPPKNSQQVEHSNHVKPGTKSSRSDHQPTPSATLLKRPLPRASVEKAAKIFENFSLSKFRKDSLPANYVHPHKRDVALHHAERTKNVRDFQNNQIKQHLHKLKTTAEQHPHKAGKKTTIRGITVAVHKEKLHKVFPSYDQAKETVVLDNVMELITKHTRGTEFYVKGDPTLNRLAFLARIDKMKQRLGLDPHGEPRGEKK